MKYQKELYIGIGFYGGDEEIEKYTEKVVKCRKNHKCSGCQNEIPTNYGHGANTQNTSHKRIQTWETKELAEIEYRHRKCGKEYEVVQVEIVEVTK